MFSGKEGALLLVWLSFMHAAVKGTNNILFYTSLTYLFEQRTSSNQNKLIKVCNRRKLHLWPFYYLLFGTFLQYCLFLTLLHPKLTEKKVFERIFSLLFYLLLFSLLSTHFHVYNSLTISLLVKLTFSIETSALSIVVFMLLLTCLRLILMLKNSSFVRFGPWYFQVDFADMFCPKI